MVTYISGQMEKGVLGDGSKGLNSSRIYNDYGNMSLCCIL